MTASKELAKRVILEIVRQAGGKLESKSRLYNAFYIAHMTYAEREPGYLSDWPIVRMPYGPGIDSGDQLIRELVMGGFLKSEVVEDWPYRTARFEVADKAFPGEALDKEAVEAIRDATKFVLDKTASELSDMTHEYSRSWNEAKDGRQLNIYIDPISDQDYEEQERHLDLLHLEITRYWA